MKAGAGLAPRWSQVAPGVVLLLSAGLILAGIAPAGRAQTTAEALPTLTSARAAHRLSSEEAARGYPVHLRGTVTYYDGEIDPRRATLFVADSSGSIYVSPVHPPTTAWKPGQLVEIVGRSAAGDFAPIVDHAQVRVIGKSHLPALAPRMTMADLRTGEEDGQWVEVEGLVYSTRKAGGNVLLEVAMSDGAITASTLRDPMVDYTSLIDARVRIRGNAAPFFNHRGQVTGAHLLFPGIATVKVLEPAAVNPFGMPVTDIGNLMRYSPQFGFRHRTHLRGVVTLFWPGRLICVQDPSEALCAETEQTTPLAVGQSVDVVGFPMMGDFTPTLIRATYRANAQTSPVAATAIAAREAFEGSSDASLVKLEGQLIGRDKAATDPTIMVSAGNSIFPVVLPREVDTGALARLEDGSRLAITGICAVQSDHRVRAPESGFALAKSFRILLRSSGDVAVQQRPSWWNAEHTLRVLALALVITIIILGWVVFLRMRLKEQTQKLQYQATHDVLTGLWNRRAVLDLLQRETDLAARTGRLIGVIMLDADRFKSINDTYGHLAGDAVLREIGSRIQVALRSSDLIGRYGGEEFLIVLPELATEDVQVCAERVREAIAASPVMAEGAQLAVTVSIGTALLDPLVNDQRDALSAADGALYEAKRSGRNRVVSSHLGDRNRSVAIEALASADGGQSAPF